MHCVCPIESVYDRERQCVGQTHDPRSRLTGHNPGKSIQTRRYKPWSLVCYLGFAEKSNALLFEKYLKSGSWKTFFDRHLLRSRARLTNAQDPLSLSLIQFCPLTLSYGNLAASAVRL